MALSTKILACTSYTIAKACVDALFSTANPEWRDLPSWKQDLFLDETAAYAANPSVSSRELHGAWLKRVHTDGWVYSSTYDTAAKHHPLCMPYLDLPLPYRLLNKTFAAAVRTLLTLPADGQAT